MKQNIVRGNRLILLSLMLTVALFIGACGGDEPEVTEPVVVQPDDAAVVEDDAAVVEDDAIVVEDEAATEEEAAIDEETEGEATIVATAVITEAGVITETEVITETDVIEVITETVVITDTSIADTTTETESEVMTETAEIDTEAVEMDEAAETGETAAFAVVIITDAEGGELLGDATSQQPLFASDQEGIVEDERFEPVMVTDDMSMDANLDSNLFGEIEQDGNRILTVNGRPVYRFVGQEGEDWRAAAAEAGLSPLATTGDLFTTGE